MLPKRIAFGIEKLERLQPAKRHPEFHARLSRYRIEHIKTDLEDLFALIARFQQTKKERVLKDVFIKWYYLLEEDIVENLTFSFADGENELSLIRLIFQEASPFVMELRIHCESKELQIFWQIIEQKMDLIRTEITIFHDEIKGIAKKRRRLLETNGDLILAKIHEKIFWHFKSLHRELNQQYANLAVKKYREIDREKLVAILRECDALFSQNKNVHPIIPVLQQETKILQKKWSSDS